MTITHLESHYLKQARECDIPTSIAGSMPRRWHSASRRQAREHTGVETLLYPKQQTTGFSVYRNALQETSFQVCL